MSRRPSFEEELVPLRDRVVCALGNLTGDLAEAQPTIAGMIAPWTERIRGLLPEKLEALTHPPKILVLNLLVPVGCNATCPGVCGTDVNNYRVKPDDLTLEDIVTLLQEFSALGGKVVRIVGIGEPILYPKLPELTALATKLKLALLVCTNGLDLPPRVLEAYARKDSTLRFEVKLWSQNPETQTRLVGPKGRRSYHYVTDPIIGSVPEVFARLREANPGRVGFRVLVYRDNLPDAQSILTGPIPDEVSVYVDHFLAQGEGRDHAELRVENSILAPTCFFSRPRWPFFAASVTQDGTLVGVLERDAKGVLVRGNNLEGLWKTVFAKNPAFQKLRYGTLEPQQL